jgi:hypothetical protein
MSGPPHVEKPTMGLDMNFQAIPDDSPLLDIEGEELQFLHLYFSGVRLGGEFGLEAARLRTAHPGIERRVYSLDRDWDVLATLLSDLGPLGQSAVKGTRKLEQAKSVQGIPINHSSSEQVALISGWIQSLDLGDLNSRWDSELMQRQGVYKFWGDQDFAPRYAERFLGLQRFYAELVEHREGLIAILD